MSKTAKPTVSEIFSIKSDLETFYRAWHDQQRDDDTYYNQKYFVVADAATPPDGFEQVRPPSASQVVDMAADHATGNFPILHVPRRSERGNSQEKSTLMEKAGQGFWYRCLDRQGDLLRQWAQSGALRGALAGSLLYDADAMPDKPLPSEYGGISTDGYKGAKDEWEGLAKSAWPFTMLCRDPLYVFPDPETEGKTYIIETFIEKAYQVKRRWPKWDYTLPGSDRPVSPTDEVEFIYWVDDTYRAYFVGSIGANNGTSLLQRSNSDGIVKHGSTFLPYFFSPGGFGSPFGNPEDRYAGLFTKAKDLLSLEARRWTHLDAIIAQYAFPNIITAPGVTLEKRLGGVTVTSGNMDPAKAVVEMRPVVPIQEIVLELGNVRGAIQRATLPDALASEQSKSDESGYLRSLKIGTGRSRIRSLTGALEQCVQWGTSGFYRLVENKVKGPVSVWGKGMGAEDEFVTIRPEDINGHYEVYASIAPSLPQDESVDIANYLKLFEHGLVPGRLVLERAARIENPEEVLRERLGEDVLKSPQFLQRLVADAMAVTGMTTGPIAAPGFASGEIGAGGAPAANPASNAGVGAPHSIPTPPSTAPGSLGEQNQIIGRSATGGAPVQGPVQGISRR